MPEIETLADLVKEFQSTPTDSNNDDNYYSSLETLEDVIQKASSAQKATSTASSHQRRGVQSENRQQAQSALLAAAEAIRLSQNFHTLYELVKNKLRGINGLGDLYCYDTSRRIGAFLGLFPERIYLHRGTKEGAKALRLEYTRPYLNMVSLPSELKRLDPRHVEDFLCRYKDRLKNVHV